MNPPLTLISSMATKRILAELVGNYTKATGCEVANEAAGGVDVAKRVQAGERFDLVVLAQEAVQQLVTGGHILSDTLLDFARSSTAVAVRSGATRPAICDEAALRELITPPQLIAISSGPSGTSVRKLLQKWGMGDEILNRIVQAPPGTPVARLIASGEAGVGFQQLSELLGEPGIDILDVANDVLLPPTVFSVGLCRAAENPARARALAAYLVSTEAESTKRRHGMAPTS